MLSGMSTDKVNMSDDSRASLYNPLNTYLKIHLENVVPECSNEESSDVPQEPLDIFLKKSAFHVFFFSKRRQEKIKVEAFFSNIYHLW